jgi:hypothetical protein
MKLAVIGSRNFNNKQCLFDCLNQFNTQFPITEIISGGAKGADSLGFDWAISNNIPTKIFKPDWAKYGKGAGFIRNKDIINNSEYVIAFWDGNSKGTKNSIELAKKLNKELKIIYV